MHNNNNFNFLIRLIALGALAGLCLGAPGAGAATLNTGDFTAACSEDPSVTDDPSFDDGKVTPKAFCECVATALEKNNLSQKDVDMLTKMHNEDISDADAEAYPTLEDLMNANEDFEDGCREALGLPTDIGTDMEEEEQLEGEMAPDGEEDAPADDEAPADDDGSPPE
ncbi:MAG: hypothetical protein AB7V40_00830 [Methyloceanibacter sp.]